MMPTIFAKGRRLSLATVVISALLQAGLSIVIAFKMRIVFAAFSNHSPPPYQALGIILIAGLLILGLRIVEKTVAQYAAQHYVRELRVALFNQISRLPAQELSKHRQGSLQLRFVGDLAAIRQWVSSAIPKIMTAICLFPALLYLLYWLHYSMFFAGLIVAILCTVLLYLSNRFIKEIHAKNRQTRGSLANFVITRIALASLIRICGLRSRTSRRIFNRASDVMRVNTRKSSILVSYNQIPDVCLQVLSIACLILAFNFSLSTADAAIVIAVLSIFQQPLKDIATFWDKFYAFKVASNKCAQVLQRDTITAGTKTNLRPTKRPTIQASNVCCHGVIFPNIYAEENVNILIQGGCGSGKTTFLQTFAGLIKPEKGEINIDTINNLRLSEASRPRIFHYQGDHIPIFAGSLRQVIMFGVYGDCSRQLIREAVHRFQLDTLCERLGGIDGKVLEQGKNLSRQEIYRIGLIRAWLSESKILLLDDIDSQANIVGENLLQLLFQKPNINIIATCVKPLFPDYFSQQIQLD